MRSHEGANPGVALIRDGDGTRSFETLMRYRSAAMAEFMRALKTLKALQAEQADLLEQMASAELPLEVSATQLAVPAAVRAQPSRPAARLAHSDRHGPNEPEPRMQYLLPEPPIAGPALHEPAASPMPNEPESRVRSDEFMTAQPQLGGTLHEEAACWIPNEPAPRSKRATESQGRMDRMNKCRING